ncbi:NAD(P)-binding domain-containing protein [Microbacterium sp. NIBRBAC000506063]|uniref:NAD(P)-binding domain-containing protein n=1 Tax=Microbacterium sp. NIBRBAC000506063 TaxID=2734618 RepID=UPI001BB56EC3|nr:NAD(P)-binding domain-containing protein [Microbacterium sp. NIBRBAC000506063]QTV80491.1 NAD(P)-dependent oxidoreductase [Microbacterium sp. NIBRBAC000506063]
MSDVRRTSDESIALVGLGSLGSRIASRLTACGVRVIGVDPHPTQGVAASVDMILSDIGEVSLNSVGRILLVVRMPDQVELILERLIGMGITEAMPVHVVTTLDVDYARSLVRWRDRGIAVIESPVSGGSTTATGELTVLIAGAHTEIERAFWSEYLASSIFTFADYGQPTVAKLLNNATMAINSRIVIELLRVGVQLGIDAPTLFEIVRSGSGRSRAAERLPTLDGALLDKDLGLLHSAVAGLDVGPLLDASFAVITDLAGDLDSIRPRLESAGATA